MKAGRISVQELRLPPYTFWPVVVTDRNPTSPSVLQRSVSAAELFGLREGGKPLNTFAKRPIGKGGVEEEVRCESRDCTR